MKLYCSPVTASKQQQLHVYKIMVTFVMVIIFSSVLGTHPEVFLDDLQLGNIIALFIFSAICATGIATYPFLIIYRPFLFAYCIGIIICVLYFAFDAVFADDTWATVNATIALKKVLPWVLPIGLPFIPLRQFFESK